MSPGFIILLSAPLPMGFNNFLSFILTATLTSVISLAAPAIDTAALDSALDSRWDNPAAPGGAIIIAAGDSIVYERYSGMADLTSRRPITSSTRFNIASVSKQFTVMALLREASRYRGGLPLLDTPLDSFLCYTQPWWHDITPGMLASHSSGLGDHRTGTREWKIAADDNDAIAYFETLGAPDHGPGEYYDYLNPSFILLARIVEQLSDEEFTEYAGRHLFAPAAMHDTYFFEPTAAPADQAHAYRCLDNGRWEEFDYGEETFFATRPDGGIYSTARDMISWLGALRDGKVLPRAWVDLSRRPRVNVSDSPHCDYQRRPDTWYALGQFVEHPDGSPVKIYHTGDNGGFQAYLAYYPVRDLSIVVLENRHDRSRSQLVNLIDRILGTRK